MKQLVEVPGISEHLRAGGKPVSAAVRANGFIFVSSLPPIDPATGRIEAGRIADQARRCIEALQQVLQTAGSGLDKVVSVRIHCSAPEHFDAVEQVYAQYFRNGPPARSFVALGSWPKAYDIEIECVALD